MTAIRVLSVGFLWLINLFPQPDDILVVRQNGYPSGDSYRSQFGNELTSTHCWNLSFFHTFRLKLRLTGV